MSDFFQQGPSLSNQFTDDTLLQKYLRWKMPSEIYKDIQTDLESFGQKVITNILEDSIQAENSPPIHIPYDCWGKRIDKIQVSTAWKNLKAISATEGLVAIGYERKQHQYSRLYQFAKLYLFHPSSAFYTCPLAMTDGAARVLEIHGDEIIKKRIFSHLISRNKDLFWTSGQWMTERTGGSDVSQTSTTAAHKENSYFLSGTKWFTSATNSEIALTLARTDENSNHLSLFCVELRDQNSKLQNIFVHRLKDKLGTKALPTAELTLNQTPAYLIDGIGNGVRKIASMLNITRLYNSITALGHMRRCFALASDYAKKRTAFGKLIIKQPLHAETLCSLRTTYEGCFHLVFYLVELLGKVELNCATEEQKKILRALTPIAKLYSAKKTIEVSSETLECFGGAGYIEDTGLPKFLRDAQVYSIWEGTTNILSLDVLRALNKEQSYPLLEQTMIEKIKKISESSLSKEVEKIEQAIHTLSKYVATTKSKEEMQIGARQFAYSLAKIFTATLMIEYCAETKCATSIQVLKRWCRTIQPEIYVSLDAQKLLF